MQEVMAPQRGWKARQEHARARREAMQKRVEGRRVFYAKQQAEKDKKASVRASAVAGDLSMEHRGFGRYHIMRGGEIMSGPHTKEEAQKILGTSK